MSTTGVTIVVSDSVAALLPRELIEGKVALEGAPVSVCSVHDPLAEAAPLLAGVGDAPVVLFLSPTEARGIPGLPPPCHAPPRRWAAIVVDAVAKEGQGDAEVAAWHESVLAYRTTALSSGELRFLLQRSRDAIDSWAQETAQAGIRAAELSETSADLEALVGIGQSLSQEKDQGRLMRTILSTCKQITGADAGSVYVVEPGGQGTKQLRIKYSHTFSKVLPFEERVVPYNTKSISGYVAVTGRVLNIPDVYLLDSTLPYSFYRTFDKDMGYRTKSMLVVPMRNHVDDVIGVIQLINCKEADPPLAGNEAFQLKLEAPGDYDRYVVPFKPRYESLMQAVASQAAIAIENSRMVAQIQSQFEQFVRASVNAIDSRDPPTSGHSARVAQMCLNTARAIDAAAEGPFAEVRFSEHGLREIELAGLLHDFGKVYIDAPVFLKARKLYPADFAYLMLRLEYLHRSIELGGFTSGEPTERTGRRLEALKGVIDTVKRLNEPTVLTEDRSAVIRGVQEQAAELAASDLSGAEVPLLTAEESKNLSIAKGTLNDEERLIIQSHVEHTYAFVEKIPWPAEFLAIPRIVRGHHEKLDGSGYPDRLRGKEAIPLQARIMAVADIYDALAATDRPYKKSVPRDRVFAILREEAAKGQLDADVVELFIECKAYDVPRTDAPATA